MLRRRRPRQERVGRTRGKRPIPRRTAASAFSKTVSPTPAWVSGVRRHTTPNPRRSACACRSDLTSTDSTRPRSLSLSRRSFFYPREIRLRVGIADQASRTSHQGEEGMVRSGARRCIGGLTGDLFLYHRGLLPRSTVCFPPPVQTTSREFGHGGSSRRRRPVRSLAQHQVPGYLKKVVAQAVRRQIAGCGAVVVRVDLHDHSFMPPPEVDAEWSGAVRSRSRRRRRFHTRSSAHVMLSCVASALFEELLGPGAVRGRTAGDGVSYGGCPRLHRSRARVDRFRGSAHHAYEDRCRGYPRVSWLAELVGRWSHTVGRPACASHSGGGTGGRVTVR